MDGSLFWKCLRVFPAIHSLGASKKWPNGICAALLRSLHCYGLVVAKERKARTLTCYVANQRHSTSHPHKGVGLV
jgi:hypothetical protein